ncbi:MAG: hypothetical protein A2566_03465 [Candidatus Zambryskibacteria bacterium RIFOXYD1_FULL_40_13]|nr:MAG: hypothetical protein A2123_01115 [Candidatus Zambryskibacteria bacterium GWB1_40_5]OHB15513.1 MAG: hypothetical protein A2566_03465 [Candidatus Zambryskibacteria bacterium RIFOXYD1_FULL_40_13]
MEEKTSISINQAPDTFITIHFTFFNPLGNINLVGHLVSLFKPNFLTKVDELFSINNNSYSFFFFMFKYLWYNSKKFLNNFTNIFNVFFFL